MKTRCLFHVIILVLLPYEDNSVLEECSEIMSVTELEETIGKVLLNYNINNIRIYLDIQ